MPFINKNRYMWNASSIIANAPRQIGVYAILGSTGCIHVGHGDVQAQLLRNQNNSRIAQGSPSAFMFDTCRSEQEARDRERALIAELNPTTQMERV